MGHALHVSSRHKPILRPNAEQLRPQFLFLNRPGAPDFSIPLAQTPRKQLDNEGKFRACSDLPSGDRHHLNAHVRQNRATRCVIGDSIASGMMQVAVIFDG